jgi:hypothetical protein
MLQRTVSKRFYKIKRDLTLKLNFTIKFSFQVVLYRLCVCVCVCLCVCVHIQTNPHITGHSLMFWVFVLPIIVKNVKL